MSKNTKKKINLLSMLEKHAASANEAKRIYNILSKACSGADDEDIADEILNGSMFNLGQFPGMGRKTYMVVAAVACDLMGKK